MAHGDGPSRRYAYVNWFWWGTFMPFIYSNGGEVFTRDRRAQFSSPEVVDALQFLIDLVHVDQVAVNPHTYEGPWFLEEGYAMYSAGVWDLPGYRYTHRLPLSGTSLSTQLTCGNRRSQPRSTMGSLRRPSTLKRPGSFSSS